MGNIAEAQETMTHDVCEHDIAAREAAVADGACPICLAALLQAERVKRQVLEKRVKALDKGGSESELEAQRASDRSPKGQDR